MIGFAMENALNDKTEIPLYAQLFDILMARINSREWSSGFKLPSERELCDTYHVSRITVRKALNELAIIKKIHSVPGKGTFVSYPQLRNPLRPLSSFSSDMRQRGYIPYSKILMATIVNADTVLANKIGVAAGAEIVQLKRLRLVAPDNIPVAVQTSHIPHKRVPNLLSYDLEKLSLFNVLKDEYRLVLDRAETVIAARLATSEEIEQLQLVSPAAVLDCEQITYLNNGEVIELVDSVFRSDVYQLTVVM